ncbi:hypothetical protein GOP47_0012416 [Adiantum capillus-veneris]|uniref:Uncharacterized protein n=1 Tax=Adiantum capillus-veneris TaxID=13818 RepID=A0A9D4ZGG6_ADICA|nr:hypothetical protein GOP47_0012416 [Adiantum capillus-veneris]
MAGLWRRFKLCVRRVVLRLVWRIVSTRLYRALRSLVSACLVPLGAITSGALIGLAVATSTGFAIGYGALIGAAGAFVAFLVFKLGNEVWIRIQFVNNLPRRLAFGRKDERSFFSRSSQSRQRGR